MRRISCADSVEVFVEMVAVEFDYFVVVPCFQVGVVTQEYTCHQLAVLINRLCLVVVFLALGYCGSNTLFDHVEEFCMVESVFHCDVACVSKKNLLIT